MALTNIQTRESALTDVIVILSRLSNIDTREGALNNIELAESRLNNITLVL